MNNGCLGPIEIGNESSPKPTITEDSDGRFSDLRKYCEIGFLSKR